MTLHSCFQHASLTPRLAPLNSDRVFNNEYIPNLYARPPSRYSTSRNYHHLSLPRPRIDIFKTSISFSGAFLWNKQSLTIRSCHSLSSFKRKLREHLEEDKHWLLLVSSSVLIKNLSDVLLTYLFIHELLRATGAVNTICFVWKFLSSMNTFSCIRFHLLVHAYMY